MGHEIILSECISYFFIYFEGLQFFIYSYDFPTKTF
jgi:hypothetical protein